MKKEIKRKILIAIYQCAYALATDDYKTYRYSNAKLSGILEACFALDIDINIHAIYRLMKYYTKKYKKHLEKIKQEEEEENRKREERKKVKNELKQYRFYQFCKKISRYVYLNRDRFLVIEIAKNAIYKQRVKTFKVLTCFNGNYMLHTALF